MPLKIETTDFGAAPLFLCDHCSQPIADACDGNYQWLADGDAETGPTRRFAFFTHKRCCDAFERERGGAAAWYAMELVDLVPSLARALRVDRQAAGANSDPSGRFG